jgi:hypothetical protein
MNERGYVTVRKGKNRISCYIISKHSKILGLLDNNAQTWHLMIEPLIDGVYKNNINQKNI